MKEEKETKIKRLYAVAAASAQSPGPKHALFRTKCPKCDKNLNKESVKEIIVAFEDGTEFAKKVAADAHLPPGSYKLTINHYTCGCGYEFAKSETESLTADIS